MTLIEKLYRAARAPLFLVVLLAGECAVSDTIYLKNGFRIDNTVISEVNSIHIVFTQRGIPNRISIHDVSKIEQTTPHQDSSGFVVLRNGIPITGNVAAVVADSVTLVTEKDSAEISFPASEVQYIRGRINALSYRSPDNKFIFLTGRTIYFEEGKPLKTIQESSYRFTFSPSVAFPAGSFQFSIPGKLNGSANIGTGVCFQMDHQISADNAMVFACQYFENTIVSSDSLGSDFSSWKNTVLMFGLKKYLSWNIIADQPTYIEGSIGGLFTSPPENDRFFFDKAFTFAFSAGCGIYLSDHLTAGIRYLNANTAVHSSLNSKQFVPSGAGENISMLLFSIGYSIRSGN